MTYYTKDLPQGEERGFKWVRVVGDNGKIFHFACAPGTEIPEKVDFNGRFQNQREPFPFSDGDIGESTCMRDVGEFQDFDWVSWLDEHVRRPEGCDIKIVKGYMSKDIRLYAQTFRRGRIETVTRKIDGTKDLLPQVREAYGYYERNCPAPTEEERRMLAISSVGQQMLSHIKKEGLDLVRAWHEKMEERYWSDQTAYGYPSLSVDGLLLTASGISKMTFERKAEHRQILVAIDFTDGHSYVEDDKGATTRIKGEYGDVIVTGAKGRTLSDYIGLPGADTQTIRTSGMEWDEESSKRSNPRMKFRSSVENVAFEIPEGTDDTEEEVMSDLRELIGPEAYFVTAEAGIMTHLSVYPPRDLRRILSLLRAEKSVDLKDHGGPRITLKSPGGHISTDYAARDELPDPSEIYKDAA